MTAMERQTNWQSVAGENQVSRIRGFVMRRVVYLDMTVVSVYDIFKLGTAFKGVVCQRQ